MDECSYPYSCVHPSYLTPLNIKGKMHCLPTAGPEEATHEDEAPEAFKVTTENNDIIANLVDPEQVDNYHSSAHIQEMLNSCKNCRRNLMNI